MSQEILEALANENLQLVKMSMDHDSEISKEMIKLGKLRADFEKVLSEEEKEAFENMKNTSELCNRAIHYRLSSGSDDDDGSVCWK